MGKTEHRLILVVDVDEDLFDEFKKSLERWFLIYWGLSKHDLKIIESGVSGNTQGEVMG